MVLRVTQLLLKTVPDVPFKAFRAWEKSMRLPDGAAFGDSYQFINRRVFTLCQSRRKMDNKIAGYCH
jgi:hypothetical protein